jgi:hypothetical protein
VSRIPTEAGQAFGASWNAIPQGPWGRPPGMHGALSSVLLFAAELTDLYRISNMSTKEQWNGWVRCRTAVALLFSSRRVASRGVLSPLLVSRQGVPAGLQDADCPDTIWISGHAIIWIPVQGISGQYLYTFVAQIHEFGPYGLLRVCATRSACQVESIRLVECCPTQSPRTRRWSPTAHPSHCVSAYSGSLGIGLGVKGFCSRARREQRE